MKLGITVLICACRLTFAIGPLPYPIESPDFESLPGIPVWREAEVVPGYSELYSKSQLREMTLPRFEGQSKALGYTDGAFMVPMALQGRVDFWKRIYTVQTSTEAVLHDSKNLGVQYGVVDVSHIAANPDKIPKKKRAWVQDFLKKAKKNVERNLALIDSHKDSPSEIPLDLFKLFRLFPNAADGSRFKAAKQNVRAQVGQRDRIIQGFLFSGRYLPKMMQIFERKQLPKELTRLPFVESAFNLNARSKVGASGIWQFMPETAKRFLRVDRAIDERNDPILATQAAAELLRLNYEALGNWPLAITAYNHGREGMLRAVQSLQTRDLSEIIERYEAPTFGFASANFYAEFLAILEVEREYRKYFGQLQVDPPLEVTTMTLSKDISFEEVAGACRMPEDQLAIFNLAFTDKILTGELHIPAKYPIQIPPTQKEACVSGLRNVAGATS